MPIWQMKDNKAFKQKVKTFKHFLDGNEILTVKHDLFIGC